MLAILCRAARPTSDVKQDQTYEITTKTETELSTSRPVTPIQKFWSQDWLRPKFWPPDLSGERIFDLKTGLKRLFLRLRPRRGRRDQDRDRVSRPIWSGACNISATNTLIISLAVADLLFIVMCVPFTAVSYVITVWPFGTVWCMVSHSHL